jgi:ankyrin repeat protein
VNEVINKDDGLDEFNECTALCRASDPEIIKLLLEAKSDVNPEGCESVMKAACQTINVDAVKMLLDAGASPIGEEDQWSPLYHVIHARCADHKQVEDKVAIINLLLAAGADPWCIGGERPALHDAICSADDLGRIDMMRALIQHDSSLLQQQDEEDEQTPLMVAVSTDKRCASVVKVLVDAGADVHDTDALSRPILFVLLLAHVKRVSKDYVCRIRDILNVLLGAGADMTACDDEGRTLLLSGFLTHTQYSNDVPDAHCSAFISIIVNAFNRALALRQSSTNLESLQLIPKKRKASSSDCCSPESEYDR